MDIHNLLDSEDATGWPSGSGVVRCSPASCWKR